jgi:hypothetical protein
MNYRSCGVGNKLAVFEALHDHVNVFKLCFYDTMGWPRPDDHGLLYLATDEVDQFVDHAEGQLYDHVHSNGDYTQELADVWGNIEKADL